MILLQQLEIAAAAGVQAGALAWPGGLAVNNVQGGGAAPVVPALFPAGGASSAAGMRMCACAFVSV